MGYYIKLLDAVFSIPVAREEEAMRVLGPFHADICIGAERQKNRNLGTVFKDLAWPLKKQGDEWVMVPGPDVKRGWEEELFEKVEPFVTAGSYISARGEDGEMFRWSFRAAVEQEPSMFWINRARITVPVAKLRDAFAELQSKLPKLLAKLDDPISVTSTFDRLGWKTTRAKDGTLEVSHKSGEAKQLTDRDRKVLKVLAAFVTPESFVETQHEQGRLDFATGQLVKR